MLIFLHKAKPVVCHESTLRPLTPSEWWPHGFHRKLMTEVTGCNKTTDCAKMANCLQTWSFCRCTPNIKPKRLHHGALSSAQWKERMEGSQTSTENLNIYRQDPNPHLWTPSLHSAGHLHEPAFPRLWKSSTANSRAPRGWNDTACAEHPAKGPQEAIVQAFCFYSLFF